MPVSFKTSQDDFDLIAKIAHRAQEEIFVPHGSTQTTMDTIMDLSACIAQGCPLKLKELLEAEPFDFSHDILGIRRHIDRSDNSPTGGHLLDCFVPRFAKPKENEVPE